MENQSMQSCSNPNVWMKASKLPPPTAAQLIDSLPQMVFWRDRNLEIGGCNKSFAQFFGLPISQSLHGKTESELIDMCTSNHTSMDVLIDSKSPLNNQLVQGNYISDREVLMSQQSGVYTLEISQPDQEQVSYFEIRKYPIQDGYLGTEGVIISIEDISDRIHRQISPVNPQRIQEDQIQLIQNEKMSSLGQLVAGIAHEINNPVNFIYGNIDHADNYIQDLLQIVQLYQALLTETPPEINELAELIDLDFIMHDLPKLLASIKVGAQRIREIVLSLRTFSRMDEAEMKAVNIHEGIDSTIMILEHRLKSSPTHSAIQVIKEYGDLPLIECYAGQLNQVFMNIISNSIDALEEFRDSEEYDNLLKINPDYQCQIKISTQLLASQKVRINIVDNGMGIPDNIKSKLFDPFFTTKPIGKGTGMGLSISYKIITEKHQGAIECISEYGKGTEFMITIPMEQY